MSDSKTPTLPEDDLALPPALVAALRQADALPAREGFDAQVLAQAQLALAAAHQARRRRMRFALWTGGALLAAACAALVVTLSLQQGEPARTGDIRDAFALARALRDGAQVGKQNDINHDGRIDGQDVRALAMLAVAMKGESR